MSGAVLIAQVTDCHLPADQRQPYRGINPYQNLKSLLTRLCRIKPDLILATGDLSEDGSPESYRALQDLLRPLGVPVLALPGNHDDAHVLAEIFPGSPVDGIGVSEHGAWKIVRLNSSLPGRPEGHVSETTMEQLEGFLQKHDQCPLIITLHHQPVHIGSPWIDKYALLEPDVFLELIDRSTNVQAVVWGHVHQVFEAERNGTLMLGGPSSAVNGIPGAQKFTPDNIGPASRWLKLKQDKTLLTGVIR